MDTMTKAKAVAPFTIRMRTWHYNFGESEPVPDDITQKFRELAGDLYRDLPFPNCTDLERSDKSVLWRLAVQSIEQVDRMGTEARGFLLAIVNDIEIRGAKSPQEEQKLRADKQREIQASIPPIRRSRLKPMSLQLMAHGTAAQVRAVLEQALKQAVDRVIEDLFAGLEKLVQSQQVGVIEWVSSEVCSYQFFRAIVIQERGAERSEHTRSGNESRTTVKQEVTQTHRAARHTHDLIEARCCRLPAKDVPKPERVEALIAATPRWLRGMLRAVSGMQIREQIVERDLRTEKSEEIVREDIVYHWDPALTLDHFVLAGWTERELPQPEKASAMPARKPNASEGFWEGCIVFGVIVAAIIGLFILCPLLGLLVVGGGILLLTYAK